MPWLGASLLRLREDLHQKRCRRALAAAAVFRDLACRGRAEGEIEGQQVSAVGRLAGRCSGGGRARRG